MNKIILPNKKELDDAIIIPSALEPLSNGKFVSDDVFERLSAVPKQPVGKEIVVSEDGLEPILVTGAHPSLHYRGNALKRHKIWAQTFYSAGLAKYGYTGWQHAVSAATRDVVAYPDLDKMMKWLNANFSAILEEHGLPGSPAVFNHAIFTRYEDEKDFIGMHSDKEKDFAPGSYFVVFKLGAARDFAFSTNDTVFWQETLPTGTMIIVRMGTANQRVKHGVPVMAQPCGASGSIVFRCIRTIIPWPDVKKNIERARQQKKKRAAAKRPIARRSKSAKK